MKYAKFSDDFLSDFRLDDNGETLVLTDKRGYTRAVKLLPYEERTQGDLISREALKKCAIPCELHNGALTDLCVPLYQIDNAPTVEPEKVLVANVTFDKDQLEQLVRDRVIEPIKNGELVLQTDERPHGEWLEPFESNGKTYHKCTHCHISSQLILFGNFCPNCGADMRGGEDNR